jgi:alcohol dehydrogenase (cytochrome c)
MNRTLALLALGAVAACTNQPSPTQNAADWSSYNGNLKSQRYSTLSEITTQNVGSLKRVCSAPLDEMGANQSGPLVVNGTIYATTAHNTYAIDGTTCKSVWKNTYTSTEKEPFPVDRGVALAGDRLIRGGPDGGLFAIDVKTGKTLWSVHPASGNKGEFLSSAPIVWNDTAYIGTAGSDWGVKGRLMAFDVSDGKQKWSFTTIATGNDPNAKTWKNVRSRDTGGGGMWTSYSLDPATGELFVPVANPAPDFASGYRPGDNLYTDSVVVLDANNGTLKWFYQALPHDVHDWDMSTAPVLYETPDGKSMLGAASKDGNLYGIDRSTHKLVYKTPQVRMLNTMTAATTQGVRICPGVLGGSEWNGAAWDQKNNHLITPMDDWCATLKLGSTRYIPGQFFFGGSYVGEPFSAARGAVTATNLDDGKIAWQYKSMSPMLAGVTPTAGGVVFTGDMGGNVLALDSATGKLLFKDKTQGSIAGGVVTYGVNNKQYVVATSGNISRLTWGTQGKPSLVVYSL